MLSKVYAKLALLAGEQAGVAFDAGADEEAKVISVAVDDDAAALRDTAWMEYESRLRDPSFSLARLGQYLKAAGITVGKSSIARDRDRLKKTEGRTALVNAKIKAVFGELKGLDPAEMHRKGLQLAMQKLLDWMLNLRADRLDAMAPAQIIEALKVFGNLGKILAQTDVIQETLREKREAAKAAVAKTAGAAADGRMSREDVYKILDDVMKGEAA